MSAVKQYIFNRYVLICAIMASILFTAQLIAPITVAVVMKSIITGVISGGLLGIVLYAVWGRKDKG